MKTKETDGVNEKLKTRKRGAPKGITKLLLKYPYRYPPILFMAFDIWQEFRTFLTNFISKYELDYTKKNNR